MVLVERKIDQRETTGGTGVSFSAREVVVGNRSFLQIEVGDSIRQVPIFNIRNPEDHIEIAKAAASGQVGAFDVGVIGAMVAIGDPRRKDDYGQSLSENAKIFWERLKPGRGKSEKLPMMMHLEHQYKAIDFNRVHKDFRHLADVRARARLYSVPLHAIWPYNERADFIHPALVTQPEDTLTKPTGEEKIPTVCIFFPGNDDDWRSVAYNSWRYNPHVIFGVTSFNASKEQPPFNKQQLVDYVNKKGKVGFDYFVFDPVAENARVWSSHTQVRIPHAGEEPVLRIIRKGPVSPELIEEVTGYRVTVHENAKVASRGYPPEQDLTEQIKAYMAGAERSRKQKGNKSPKLRPVF